MRVSYNYNYRQEFFLFLLLLLSCERIRKKKTGHDNNQPYKTK
jgi:hypothetical protein